MSTNAWMLECDRLEEPKLWPMNHQCDMFPSTEDTAAKHWIFTATIKVSIIWICKITTLQWRGFTTEAWEPVADGCGRAVYGSTLGNKRSPQHPVASMDLSHHSHQGVAPFYLVPMSSGRYAGLWIASTGFPRGEFLSMKWLPSSSAVCQIMNGCVVWKRDLFYLSFLTGNRH